MRCACAVLRYVASRSLPLVGCWSIKGGRSSVNLVHARGSRSIRFYQQRSDSIRAAAIMVACLVMIILTISRRLVKNGCSRDSSLFNLPRPAL